MGSPAGNVNSRDANVVPSGSGDAAESYDGEEEEDMAEMMEHGRMEEEEATQEDDEDDTDYEQDEMENESDKEEEEEEEQAEAMVEEAEEEEERAEAMVEEVVVVMEGEGSTADSALTAAFKRTYAKFTGSQKWKLKSGRHVEDLLFNGYFSLEDPLHNSVASLVTTTQELREVLETTSYRPQNTEFDREQHFDLHWANEIIDQFLTLWETPYPPLLSSHLEGWYAAHVWTPLLDKSILQIPRMTVERTEVECRATVLRQNRGRESPHKRRQRKGVFKLDAIICTIDDNFLEFGCMETSRTFKGMTATKWLNDSKKLERIMRDMLGRLVHIGSSKKEKVQVVGITTAGLTIRFSRIVNVASHVCLIQREDLQQVPTTVNDLQALLLLLATVVRIKRVIAESLDAVTNNHLTGDEFQEIWKNGGDTTALGSKSELPWSADSP
ncbi:hypothetical protein FN846DRAFT_1009577 [Sphaerosporella brunnea]|uniref:Uncharacterized protein n=1 Tax=Sphaerosporella brunnea TaxID=1250544 RepID=A0A5J5ECH9_9PEZI|nr:hypothetical protein FN846DRAFT_1009577 [Sphaerosporella brunnea]